MQNQIQYGLVPVGILVAALICPWDTRAGQPSHSPAGEYPPVEVRQVGQVVSIENALVRVRYDLTGGIYTADDKKKNRTIITRSSSQVGTFSSTMPGIVHRFHVESLADALGMGKSLLIRSTVPRGPTLFLRISLYNNQGFLVLSSGLENTTDQIIHLKEFSPLFDAIAFQGFDTQTRYHVLDGNGGGAPTFVTHDGRTRTSRNNLLITFGERGANRSLVLGGLVYAEFDKSVKATRTADHSLTVRLYAADPVGKRIDPGTRYLPEDRFYLDFMTDNPFDALEAYADRVRIAQSIVLPVYHFSIVDTWFAQVPHFGGGEDRKSYRAQNDSVGAVEEMQCVVKSGFLKYAPVAVLLEPAL